VRTSTNLPADIFADVKVFDVCTGQSLDLPEVTDMRVSRFAVVTCKSPGGWGVTCGGTSDGTHNLDTAAMCMVW
jgi:hypothetical protein